MLRSKGIVKARPGSRAQGGITLRSEQGELAVVSDVAYFVCSIDVKKPLRTLSVVWHGVGVIKCPRMVPVSCGAAQYANMEDTFH